MSSQQSARGIFRSLTVAAALAVLLAGCGGGSGSSGGSSAPTVTVKVKGTDCPIDKLKITVTVQQYSSGGALHLQIHVNATCGAAPLNGVTLTATIPGATSNTTLKTDPSGNADTDVLTPGNHDLVGQTVGIAVEGDDGKMHPEGSATVTKAP